MRELLAAGAAIFVAALLRAPGLGADVKPWEGTNPFACELQYAGRGTDFTHPQADPFCVEYDKTHQNVTQLGVVDFLSKEPARVAAASPKYFYFQRDHWTGYVVQGDQSTQTYHWDGDYFFDKAKGAGGVHVENFSFNGQTGDPSQLPGFPDAWNPYFGPGRGGVQTFTLPADSRHVAYLAVTSTSLDRRRIGRLLAASR